MLSSKTRREYARDLKVFEDYRQSRKSYRPRSRVDFDYSLVKYAHYVYDSRNGEGLECVMNARRAVMHVFPKLQGKLLRSAAAIEGWRTEQKVERPRVCPWIVALALSNHFSKHAQFRNSVAVLLAWDCYLRPKELEALSYRDISLSDTQKGKRLRASIVIRKAKRKNATRKKGSDAVLIRREPIVYLVKECKEAHLADGGSEDDLFLGGESASVNKRRFRDAVCKAQEELEISHLGITAHSLRCGGVSQDYADKVSLAHDLKARGRFKSDKSLMQCLQPEKVLRQESLLSPSLRRRFRRLDERWELFQRRVSDLNCK